MITPRTKLRLTCLNGQLSACIAIYRNGFLTLSRCLGLFLFVLLSMDKPHLAAATLPPGFAETDVPGPGGEWNGPVGITFDSTGRMFVWERDGRVWFKDPSDSSFSLLLDISEE